MSTQHQAIARCREFLADHQIAMGEAINIRHYTDWSNYKHIQPFAVVFPKTTEQVSKILAICNELKQPIVPQGGMTGVAGAGIAEANEIVIALDKMNQIEEIDPYASTMTVEAGLTLEEAQNAARAADLYFPVDVGGRGSCQIGGNIATNAGGLSVIRYGMMRDHVLGMEVVLADGRVLNLMNKMIKNNAGYDLKQNFIGAEGTLGIVTRAVLKLSPQPKELTTCLCAFPDYLSAVKLLRHLQKRLTTPNAFEVMWDEYYQLSLSWMQNHANPLSQHYPIYAVFDVEGSAEDLENILAELFETGEILDAVIAQTQAQAHQLWLIRETVPAEISSTGRPLCFDVSMPIGQLGEFKAICQDRIAKQYPQLASLFFGHIGDSNMHIILDLKDQEEQVIDDLIHGLDEIVYDVVRQFKGSISAEHGIGLLKRDYLHYSVDENALNVMKQLKQLFDPNGILNPHKVFKSI
ncbi:FAD-binding oxidoreductase [Acinetobacter puyangensis]|uniref:FAD/FMN-containing dehydrogenase n=1 Tax=Acinetobacter puyangensis TaxID=1096779 RepID=A0A240E7T4_9GAMM|nr:FAD-binding oxidoreductase [Acinetobacter puyangensis]SNX44807.1 FAD/FMN-containing dehydrogenase [Acinetobacter puyangensis]